MKPFNTYFKFILPVLLLSLLWTDIQARQSSGSDQKLSIEKKAGKGMILQFEKKPGGDSLKTKSLRLNKVEAEKYKGQAIRFVPLPGGGYKVEIVHPDTAEAQRRYAFDVLNGKVEAKSKREDIVNGYFEHEHKSKKDYQLPLRIYTQALTGNRLKVTVENHTESPITNLRIHPNQLPDGWNLLPAEHNIATIPANGLDDFIFELEAHENSGAKQLGFQFSSNEIITTWSARVEPASSEEKSMPNSFELYGNYPNPFNPTTTISYALPEPMNVKLEIFTINGQKVATLINHRQTYGNHNVVWNAAQSASGTYIYKITAVSESGAFFVDEQKLTLIK